MGHSINNPKGPQVLQYTETTSHRINPSTGILTLASMVQVLHPNSASWRLSTFPTLLFYSSARHPGKADASRVMSTIVLPPFQNIVCFGKLS
jgi:hypothetical protein